MKEVTVYPYKWPYKWATGIITPINRVITLLIAGRGPLCMNPTFSDGLTPCAVLPQVYFIHGDRTQITNEFATQTLFHTCHLQTVLIYIMYINIYLCVFVLRPTGGSRIFILGFSSCTTESRVGMPWGIPPVFLQGHCTVTTSTPPGASNERRWNRCLFWQMKVFSNCPMILWRFIFLGVVFSGKL